MNAIIVALHNNTTEIKALAASLDYNVIGEFIQHRKIPDTDTYIGKGKIEEIKDFLEKNKVDLIIIDGELKPSQWFKLEKEFGIEVYDRIRLILSLFAKRAESKEAKLQVKLAQLQYERPFVRELIHRARAGEHPGYMAGGEYQVDDYYEMIKRQMRDIKRKLEKLRASREIKRKHRKDAGFYTIAIAGYTNAGKSSLLNLLSNEKVKVEEMLFSTLSPTTRRISKRLSSHTYPPILLTDTVGFIRDLPSWIIDAFHSTLEEIAVSDLIILMVDISEPIEEIREKLDASLRELREISAESPVLLVFNKIDRLKGEIDEKIENLKDIINNKPFVCISVKDKTNIEDLIKAISQNLPSLVEIKATLPLNEDSQRFVSRLYENAWILDIRYFDKIHIHFAVNQRISDRLINLCKKVGGRILTAK